MQRSSGVRRLIGFDLSIESDRYVPGALPDQSPGDAPDLRIKTLSSATPPSALYKWEHDTLTFSAPEVGRYACRRDVIEVAAAPNADPEMITALLIATALPAVLWLRGGTMLHAAGVVAPSGGPALAIAGPSGIGKSALTAELLDAGGMLLADDSIGLRVCGDRVAGSGLPGGYHVRRDDTTRGFHSVPVARSTRTATIGTVMVLARTDGAPALTRLNPVAALERLLANRHRPAIPAAIGRRAETLTTLAFIARNCAVYEWHRPCAALSLTERDLLARERLW